MVAQKSAPVDGGDHVHPTTNSRRAGAVGLVSARRQGHRVPDAVTRMEKGEVNSRLSTVSAVEKGACEDWGGILAGRRKRRRGEVEESKDVI